MKIAVNGVREPLQNSVHVSGPDYLTSELVRSAVEKGLRCSGPVVTQSEYWGYVLGSASRVPLSLPSSNSTNNSLVSFQPGDVVRISLVGFA